jgi:hypothetical protein
MFAYSAPTSEIKRYIGDKDKKTNPKRRRETELQSRHAAFGLVRGEWSPQPRVTQSHSIFNSNKQYMQQSIRSSEHALPPDFNTCTIAMGQGMGLALGIFHGIGPHTCKWALYSIVAALHPITWDATYRGGQGMREIKTVYCQAKGTLSVS